MAEPRNSLATYRRLAAFLRPYRAQVAGSIFLAGTATGTSILIPWLSGQAIAAIQLGDRPSLAPIVAAVLAAGVLRLCLVVARKLVAGRISLAVEADLRQLLYSHLHRLELSFFDSQQAGQLLSRATVDLQAIRAFLGEGILFLVQGLSTVLLAGAVMVAIDPTLALMALAPTLLVIWIALHYERLGRSVATDVQQGIAELTAQAEENVSGIRIVKAFAQEEQQLHRFRRSVSRVFERSVASTRLGAIFVPLIALLPQLGVAFVLLIGGRAVIAGDLSLGDFAVFYFYLGMLFLPVRTLGSTVGMAQQAAASGDRFFEIVDRQPAIQPAPQARKLPPGKGEVELRGVSVRHGDVDALSAVDLHVESGRTIALIGPSGSGKTSLVTLIGRLYDPSEGVVEVDGVDVRRLSIESLRSQVAFVSDDSFLFSSSIADNIAYARAGASLGEIRAAADRAQADDFIRELPNGYETQVGPGGLTLSGGQRQRIAIARALLADPRILILDDATSSLDASTERALLLGLRKAMAGRTTLLVAHRLSTATLADTVVVLDRGRIVDAGSHTELLARCGFYREVAGHGRVDTGPPSYGSKRETELAC